MKALVKVPAWFEIAVLTRMLILAREDCGTLDHVVQRQIEGHVPRPYRWVRRQEPRPLRTEALL